MRRVIIIGPDGETTPTDALQFIRQVRDVRFYLCHSCQGIVEAPTGEETVHECEAKP